MDIGRIEFGPQDEKPSLAENLRKAATSKVGWGLATDDEFRKALADLMQYMGQTCDEDGKLLDR